MPGASKQGFEVTHKLVLSIAVPMTIGHLTTPLFGLVDTTVIGQLGEAALLGGLAVGTILIDMLFFTFSFLRSGTVGLTAQAFGAGDKTEVQATLYRALGMSVIIGVLLAIAAPVFLFVGLWFMEPGEAAAAATTEYFQIRMISAPFAMANFAFFGWFLGQGRAKTALMLQIMMNGLNILLSIAFVIWLEWGISGVATASVIAEVTGSIAGLLLAWRVLDRSYAPNWQQIRNVAAIKRLMSINGDIMIRSFALLFAFGYFTAQSASFGEVVLAANAVLLHFFYISGYFLDGLAVAAEQICGCAIGAKDRTAFMRATKLAMVWSIVLAIGLSLIFILGGEAAIDFITKSEPVRVEAKTYFLWAALIGLAGVTAFVMDGVYIGSTWSREMSVTMVISLAGFILLWLVAKPYFGIDGLWMAFYGFLLLRGLTMALRLPRNVQRAFS